MLRSRPVVSPLRVFAVILILVFIVETGIMFVIATVAPVKSDSPFMGVLDALVLTAILCPAVWWLVVRPLRSLVEERGVLLTRLFRAQEEERTRLARDLHDELGQQLTVVLLGMRAAEQAPTVEEARQRIDVARQAVTGSLEAARRIARGLSPSVLTDFGLTVAVDRLCESVRAAGVIEIERDPGAALPRLRPEVEIAAYRVVQEAVTNAARHSGAKRVRVSLELDGDSLKLGVRDDGRGFGESEGGGGGGGGGGPSGLGMQGMRERVHLLGGAWRSACDAASGTTIEASIPRVLPET